MAFVQQYVSSLFFISMPFSVQFFYFTLMNSLANLTTKRELFLKTQIFDFNLIQVKQKDDMLLIRFLFYLYLFLPHFL